MKTTRASVALIVLTTLSTFVGAIQLEATAAPSSGTRDAHDGRGGHTPDKPRAVRLRSFRRGVSARLHFEPSGEGGKVRLTALNLPQPEAFAPMAHSYVVWAVTAAASPLRVGELQVSAAGNGGLAFAHPPQMSTYSLIVTAEIGAESSSPKGPIVLASRAREATAYFDPSISEPAPADARSLKNLRKRLQSRSRSAGFFRDVEGALDRSADGGRMLVLAGDAVAPESFGAARAATIDQQALARAIISNLPRPSSVDANTFVLWAVEPGGRMIYMGSVPVESDGNVDLYARVGGIGNDDFELAVTAESQSWVVSPSGRRALSTRQAGDEPIYGPKGYIIPKKP